MERSVIVGTPDQRHISTSIIERQDLTMRMSMRRFTRLTNGLQQKDREHEGCGVAAFRALQLRAAAQGLADAPWRRAPGDLPVTLLRSSYT